MKQIFREKYSKLPSFNIPFYEGVAAGPNEIKFFERFDKSVENGLQNANWFWGDEAEELFKTTEGRERMFKELYKVYTMAKPLDFGDLRWKDESPISGKEQTTFSETSLQIDVKDIEVLEDFLNKTRNSNE